VLANKSKPTIILVEMNGCDDDALIRLKQVRSILASVILKFVKIYSVVVLQKFRDIMG